VQLYAGLVLYGISMALMYEATLGLDSWDVFHQGLAERTGISFGRITMIVGAAVLLVWIPLRQRPGLGTLSNVVVIGLAVDAGIGGLPTPGGLALRITFLLGGIILCGFATGCYIGADFGPGPRDGLMTGLVRRTGWSIRLTRTLIELTVLALGWLLGGTVGVGTVLYAVTIGPLVQVFLPMLTVRPSSAARPETAEAAAPGAGRVGSSEAVVQQLRLVPHVRSLFALARPAGAWLRSRSPAYLQYAGLHAALPGMQRSSGHPRRASDAGH
jgi:uncharacterized membrane protein YczE